MNKNEWVPKELQLMLDEKGNRCISVIVPLASLQPLREQNQLLLDKALLNVLSVWKDRYPSVDPTSFLEKLKKLIRKIDPLQVPKGVGLYVSPNIELLKPLQFTPASSITVGENFEIRYYLQNLQLEQEYALLTLTENEMALYKGSCKQMERLSVEDILKHPAANYEYATPSRSTSYAGHSHSKSFERDQTLSEDKRLENWFHKIDALIGKHSPPKPPLIIMASDRIASMFMQHSNYPKRLQIKINKDPVHLPLHQLAELAWPAACTHFEEEATNTIQVLRELTGRGLNRRGLQECWRAAQEGNCRILLVEKNYRQPGFLSKDPYYLFLKPPHQTHQLLTDAVDDLIELTIQKKGKILFTEDGLLDLEKNVALITRY